MAFDYDLYYKVNYIQSNGTNYLNTAISPGATANRNTLRIEADMSFVTTPSGTDIQLLFGTAYNNSSTASRRNIGVGFRNSTSSSYFTYFCGSGDWAGGAAAFTGATVDANRHLFVVDQPNHNFEFDSTTMENPNVTTTFTNLTQNLLIFASRQSASANTIDYHSIARCYGFKIYRSGTLIKDFVPALRKDGTVGMFDTVEEVFVTNSGTGNFTYGDIVGKGALYIKINGVWTKGISYIKQNGVWS